MLRVLFASVLLMGSLLAVLGVQRHREDHAAADWIPVQARVIGLQVRSPMDAGPSHSSLHDKSGGHIALVVFEWMANGAAHRSARYRLEGPLAEAASREAARQALAAFRVGQGLIAYRHPQAPERAVLSREGSATGLLLATIGALIAALGLLGLWRQPLLLRALHAQSR